MAVIRRVGLAGSLLLTATGLLAQATGTTSADLRGVVTDEAGSALPGATITATNQDNGFLARGHLGCRRRLCDPAASPRPVPGLRLSPGIAGGGRAERRPVGRHDHDPGFAPRALRGDGSGYGHRAGTSHRHVVDGALQDRRRGEDPKPSHQPAQRSRVRADDSRGDRRPRSTSRDLSHLRAFDQRTESQLQQHPRGRRGQQ